MLIGLWWGNLNERDHLEGVILEWVLEKSVDLAKLGMLAGSCKHSNEIFVLSVGIP